MSLWNSLHGLFGPPTSKRNSRGNSRRSNRRGSSFQPRFESLEDRSLLSAVTGDFNHDGIADLAIGVPGQETNSVAGGAVTVLYGTHIGRYSIGLTIDGKQLITRANIGGTVQAGDQFGEALAVGDFNRDGIMDLAVGTPGQSVSSRSGAGAVYILFGSSAGLKTTGVQIWTQDSTSILDVAESGDHFGSSLAVGDFNGDRRPDLAVGVPNESVGAFSNAGGVNIIYDAAAGLNAKSNQFFSQSTAGMTGGIATGDLFGAALAAGDFDANGFQDLAIGAPGQTVGGNSATGAVSVLYGTKIGLKTTNNQFWNADSTGIQGTANANEKFGTALAAGDFNGDSRSDLAIGAPGENIPQGTGPATNNAGAVHVLFGSSARLTATNNQFWHENVTGISTTAAPGDAFGAVLAAGQLNSDHFADLAIGVPNATVQTFAAEGSTRLLFGSRTTGLSTADSQLWNSTNLSGGANDDHYGSFIAIGDFNGDRVGDLASGIPHNDPNSDDAGDAHIVYGQVGTQTNGRPLPPSINNSQLWSPGNGGLLQSSAELNLRDGLIFLANNAIQPGVAITADGLQYKVITQGTGPRPVQGDNVTVNYIGTFPDGTVFDQGQGSSFDLISGPNGVITGFAEALRLMPVGSHWMVYIPSDLAYGTAGKGNIGPNQVLIFDLTLLSIN